MLTATATTTTETLLAFDLPVRSVLNVGVDTTLDDKWPFEVKQVNWRNQAITLTTNVRLSS